MQTRSIEEVWAKDGPDWSAPDEVAAYSDWLEEQGRDAEAFGARWMLKTESKPYPSLSEPAYGWFIGRNANPRSRKTHLPPGFLKATGAWLEWSDYPSPHEAHMAVINELKQHPEKVELLKGHP